MFNPLYTALQMNNSIRSASAVNPVATENMDNSDLKPCITLLRIDTLDSQQKEMDTKEDKGKSMMRALYVLQYAKRHVSGLSDVEQ